MSNKPDRSSVTDVNLTQILSSAITIARGAGAILREGISVIEADRGTGRGTQLTFKTTDIDPVTEYDVRSEKYIVGELQQLYPTHRIVGEEGGTYDRQHHGVDGHDYEWQIDPLDGTVNFAHAFSVFCVSIGLVMDGAPMLGVVYAPILDEMFTAARGHGAARNGVPIRVSATPTLKRSLLVTGFPYDTHIHDTNLPEFVGFQHTSQAVRRLGSAALDLCYVAAGQMDGYWEMTIKAHDIAAAIAIVREAGGTVTDFDGGDSMLDSGFIVASNGLIHQPMLDVLKQARKG
jgi:myo-inositol-1(or 4)-monophosphatase